ncbi:MAG: hypothetical protein JWM11_5508 [Planctomycetaceae bacterium]|nr:hypothetical protein [Planctomycetaceae bacterium]
MQICLRRQSRIGHSCRCWLPGSVLAIVGLLFYGVSSAIAQPVTTTADMPDVSSWIRQLSSARFVEREAASNQLKMAGLVSIPELIKAALGTNPEVTARAIEALSFLYESQDVTVSLAADRALEQLLNHGPPAAAQRTEQAFAFDLAPARRRNTIAAIQDLGGIIVPVTRPDPETRQQVEMSLEEPDSIQHAILGKNWRGDLSSTKYLERLRPELRMIYVTSDAPLKPGDLDLYRNALPQMVVEPRGGYLGISGTAFDPERCEVDRIAFNSPAEHAGLRAGDRLTHMDGIPIKGFISLTTLLLKRKSGETILLEIIREPGETGIAPEELEVPVSLGEWGVSSKLAEKEKQIEKPKKLPPVQEPPVKPAVRPSSTPQSPGQPDLPPSPAPKKP